MQKRINISISEELAEDMKRYSEETGIPVSRLIEKAVKKYLDAKTSE